MDDVGDPVACGQSFQQGSVLTAADAARLFPDIAQNQVVVVISHSCDLANTSELWVEVIHGQKIDKLDGNKTHAKSPRTLHLTFEKNNSEWLCLELNAWEKQKIERRITTGCKQDCYVGHDNLKILQNWLAIRYNRQTFPDKLNESLRKPMEKIHKALRDAEKKIIAFYVQHKEKEDGYDLWIRVVANSDEFESEESAAKLAELLNKHLTGQKGLRVIECVSLMDSEMTLDQARKMHHYHLEYHSHRRNTPGN